MVLQDVAVKCFAQLTTIRHNGGMVLTRYLNVGGRCMSFMCCMCACRNTLRFEVDLFVSSVRFLAAQWKSLCWAIVCAVFESVCYIGSYLYLVGGYCVFGG